MSSAPAQPAKAVSTQPQAGVEMNVISAQGSTNSSQTQHCEHHQHKVSRLRGGGAGKLLARIASWVYSDASSVSNVARDAAIALQISS
ncbi:hypothetical protein WG66_014363, partial [Moniliophthora roreri]